VITAVPAALGVNVTEQVPADNVQLAALKVPARPLAVNPTDPAGVVAPAPLVSMTVAVQVDGWLIATVPGLQTTVVEVVLAVVVLTVPLVAPLLALPACTESLGVYVPVIVAVPEAVGVNVTEHVPADSVQLGALKVPARPVAVNATDPAGVLLPTPLVSATVAVQVDGWLIATVPGLQTTVVEVVRRVAVTEPLVAPLLALPAWTASLGV
jgi:hypothetical protein